MKSSNKIWLAGATAALALATAPASIAQTAGPATAAPTPAIVDSQSPKPRPPACRTVAHRQFNFWIGDWDVTTPDGKTAGTNLVKPILGGCVLHESWKATGGYAGESHNIYDATRKVWHQTWVDVGGNLLVLEGKFERGVITMSDRGLTGKDAALINEIAWTPNADGSVSQRWRVSNDGGKSWKMSFDGKYVRAARPQPPISP